MIMGKFGYARYSGVVYTNIYIAQQHVQNSWNSSIVTIGL